jgi:hypothetical protein
MPRVVCHVCVWVAASLLAIATVRAAPAEFVRVWPGWRDAESFERIGEYFGRAKNDPRQLTLRTRPDVRDGFYFLLRVKHAAPLERAKLVIDVIRPDAPRPVQFVFPVDAPKAGETVFDVGLTGEDWPGGRDSHPVAWRIELRGADGAVLAQEKSFLWEKPPK